MLAAQLLKCERLENLTCQIVTLQNVFFCFPTENLCGIIKKKNPGDHRSLKELLSEGPWIVCSANT